MTAPDLWAGAGTTSVAMVGAAIFGLIGVVWTLAHRQLRDLGDQVRKLRHELEASSRAMQAHHDRQIEALYRRLDESHDRLRAFVEGRDTALRAELALIRREVHGVGPLDPPAG